MDNNDHLKLWAVNSYLNYFSGLQVKKLWDFNVMYFVSLISIRSEAKTLLEEIFLIEIAPKNYFKISIF